jgi:hypothetical protein
MTGQHRRSEPGELTRRRCLGMLSAAAPVLLAGCSSAGASGGAGRAISTAAGPSSTPASASPRASAASVSGASSPSWLLTRSALAQLVINPAVSEGLARSHVYELLHPGQQPLPATGAVPTLVFASAAQLATTLRGDVLPVGTGAVLYDPEAWSFTPDEEQRDPAAAVARAASAAHRLGLQLIVSPALNLTTVLAPGSSAPRWQQFLDLGLAGALARHADLIEFQAQSLERDTASYQAFVVAAARQARSANPDVGLLAGLSTNPPGATVDSGQLIAAIDATRRHVDGFSLNIPGAGPRCPTCNPAQPAVGIEVLLAVM